MNKLLSASILFFLITTANAQSGGGGGSNFFLIKPPLVVNVYHPKRIKFLQIDTQVRVEDSSVITSIEKHIPAIRHSLLMLMSNQNFSEIRTVAGKEKLRKDALAEIKSVLKENTGKEGVTDLYFTGFIIQ